MTGLCLAVFITAAAGCGDEVNRQAAAELRTRLGAYLPHEPQQAARLALAADALHHSPGTELGLLDVAAAQLGVVRTIHTGAGRVSAVARLPDLVVSAGSNGQLQTFDASTGARLSRFDNDEVIETLASSDELGSTVASADARGRIALWDLTDPSQPRRSLLADVPEPPVMLAFTPRASTLLALDRGGRVRRFDVASGTSLSSLDLAASKALPVRDRPDVVAAALSGNEFDPAVDLLVATSSGEVVRVSLPKLEATTVVSPGQVTGKVTRLLERPFADQPIVIGTTTGVYFAGGEHSQAPSRIAGAPVRALATAETGLLVGDSHGLKNIPSGATGTTEDEIGPAVSALASSADGAVAGYDDGSVRLLGQATTGIALSEGSDTAVASFGPGNRLLVAEGYDPNHVTSLVAVKPGVPAAKEDASTAYAPLRRYRPAKSWWPQGEDDSDRWFVSGAIYDDDFVIAAGQDPTGVAVALVWNTRTGKPLARLPLTTGGVATDEPQIVTGLALLDKRELLVAYSLVHESLVMWSTTDWRRVATVYVGPIAGLTVSPDQETIIASKQSEEESDSGSGIAHSSLQFVDVAERKVTRVVPTPSAYDIGLSPDGRYLAVAADGKLRLLSPDGTRALTKPVEVEDGDPSILWRPDSELLAINRMYDTVLVDPWTGKVSGSLPAPRDATPVGLAFSSDGSQLAVTNYRDNDGTPAAPAPSIFTLSHDALRRRACALAGRRWTPKEWRRQVGADIPFRRSCPDRAAPSARDRSRPISDPIVAYRSGDRLWVANAAGARQDVGPAPQDDVTEPGFVWSPSGALAWVADGWAWVLRAGTVTSWACPCATIAFAGETLKAVDADGTAILTMTGTGVRRQPVRELPPYVPRLLAARHDQALVAASSVPPDRSTPSELYLVGPSARARHVTDTRHGAFYNTRISSPDGSRTAFVVTATSGACYTQERVGVFDFDRRKVSYPTLPNATADSVLVRSLSWPRDGRLTATQARVNCPGNSPSANGSLPTRVLTLNRSRFAIRAEVGYDVTVGSDVQVMLAAPAGRHPARGVLTIKTGDANRLVARKAGSVSVRP